MGECAALGVNHPTLGQAIVLIVAPRAGLELDVEHVLAHCRERLPVYMVPAKIDVRPSPLPRNANGKIDRNLLMGEFKDLFAERSA